MKTEQIGKRLREIRLDARLTQREMAEVVGLTSSSVGALENGLYTPNYDVLRAINKQLGASYEFIIDGVQSSQNNVQIKKENEMLKIEIERLKKIIDKLVK